jgi:hypothetical protein
MKFLGKRVDRFFFFNASIVYKHVIKPDPEEKYKQDLKRNLQIVYLFQPKTFVR